MIGKFHGHFDFAQRLVAGINEVARECRHFLMEKVFGAPESQVLKLNLRNISPLRRAKRWMDVLCSSAGWRLASRPEIKRRQYDHHRGRRHAQPEAEPRAFRFWLRNFDVRLFVHEFRVKRACAIRYAKI